MLFHFAFCNADKTPNTVEKGYLKYQRLRGFFCFFFCCCCSVFNEMLGGRKGNKEN